MKHLLILSFTICFTFMIGFSLNYNLSKRTSSQNPHSNSAKVARQGHTQISDIGANGKDIWICDSKGELKKHSQKDIKLMIQGKLEGKCLNLDVDSFGLPWVVTDKGIFKLQKVHGDSAVWINMYSKGDALDVACGTTNECYMIKKNTGRIFVSSMDYFISSKFVNQDPLIRIDVGLGKGGDVLFGVDMKNRVVEMTNDEKSVNLDILAKDISVGNDNKVYVIGSTGLLVRKRDMDKFNNVSATPGIRCSAGTNIWIVGEDKFSYEGIIS